MEQIVQRIIKTSLIGNQYQLFIQKESGLQLNSIQFDNWNNNINNINQQMKQVLSDDQNEVDRQIYTLSLQHHKLRSYIIQSYEKLFKLAKIDKVQQDSTQFLRGLKVQIWRTELKLFIKTVIMLQELNEDQVKVYFQQSFPQIVMKIDFLKSILGEQTYTKKVQVYLKLENKCLIINKYRKPLKKVNQVKVCHYCCKFIFGQGYKCNSKPQQKYSSIYSKQLLANDDKNNQEQLQYTHPYLKYSYCHKGTKSCNRIYCDVCFKNLSNEQYLQNKLICGFCMGNCDCNRCNKIKWIIKSLKLYNNINGSIEEVIKEFIFPSRRNPKIKQLNYKIQLKLEHILKFQVQRKKQKKLQKLKRNKIFINHTPLYNKQSFNMIKYLSTDYEIDENNDLNVLNEQSFVEKLSYSFVELSNQDFIRQIQPESEHI